MQKERRVHAGRESSSLSMSLFLSDRELLFSFMNGSPLTLCSCRFMVKDFTGKDHEPPYLPLPPHSLKDTESVRRIPQYRRFSCPFQPCKGKDMRLKERHVSTSSQPEIESVRRDMSLPCNRMQFPKRFSEACG